MELKNAILVDGSFFLKRYRTLSQYRDGLDQYDAVQTASDLYRLSLEHVRNNKNEQNYLYRTAKVARREGIDFVLDPMWNPIDASLFEHIDGLKSTFPKPEKN